MAFALTFAWLSVPDLPGFAALLVALLVAAIAWLVLLVATLRRRTRRRWVAVALLPCAFALLFPPALHWHRTTGPWVEFLLRRQALARVAVLGAHGDSTSISPSDLAAAGAAAAEARPGYVALQLANSGYFSNYGFVHVSDDRGTPHRGMMLFGEPVTDLLPLRDGWYFFETSSLALVN